ncbi:type II secretion system protein [Thalassotalea euphylliae]|uniref:Type II secretion system protein n=1 Tax=Thalassotalea euphylliae TaxID=1655234 RepID=A0A3E0UDZ0_9GAMM|nr:prepilin-type N-terminal cleavage/methylation domain-containing protein [Thalassotalea euphylliae]REL34315.1 type II secretion system protein [Thalassotalea euphylliae]
MYANSPNFQSPNSLLPGTKLHNSNVTKAAGFTLIELVVVIVILGILSAVAVPRFINLSSDANEAALEALAGSLESTANLYNSKALVESRTDNGFEFEGIFFDQGYPIGISFNDSDNVPEILEAMNLSDDFVFNTIFNDSNADNQVARGLYLTNKAPNNSPTAAEIIATNCYVSYKSAVVNAVPPEVITVTTGC